MRVVVIEDSSNIVGFPISCLSIPALMPNLVHRVCGMVATGKSVVVAHEGTEPDKLCAHALSALWIDSP